MLVSYEILYLFQSPQGCLVEIKRLDQPADAPKNHDWLWLTDRSATSLHFQHMEAGPPQVRVFKEGQLHFDDARAELTWRNGEVVELTPRPRIGLGSLHQQLVHNHLS